MVWAITALSVALLIMTVLFLLTLVKMLYLQAENETMVEVFRSFDIRLDMIQRLIRRKFDYCVPISEKYLERELDKPYEESPKL